MPAGAIRDDEGHVLGRHDGVHRFTIGQRKGLGLATGIPLYVVGIDADDASVTVGPREALERDDADRVTRELDERRDPAGADPRRPRASATATRRPPRRSRRSAMSRAQRHLRRAAERHHARTGRRLL